MLSDKALQRGRVLSVIAATLVALACGTNYVYSAWAPQFAERLKLSATSSNLIGVFGNLGMYGSGIPVGLLVDAKGPRFGVLIGILTIGPGYFALHKAYDAGEGSTAIPLLCIFSLITGIGSCATFSSCLKTCAVNWPDHRGTATAFPLAAFGLSALFFATISSIAFPNDTSDFLFLLSVGTFSLIVVCAFFLRLLPQTTYATLPMHEPDPILEANVIHRTRSSESKRYSYSASRMSLDPEAPKDSSSISKDAKACGVPEADASERSSLMSRPSTPHSVDLGDPGDDNKSHYSAHSHHLDIRGLSLIRKAQFWQLFCMMGLLTGIGLMTINNIGNDAQALWKHWDDSVDSGFISKRQLTHVSILSFLSFSGRLLSGVGSDIIVKKLQMSRYWNICFSSIVFLIAQIFATNVSNPHYLVFVSGLTGLAYGFLFGVYPSLVADAFGTPALSQNWGCMTLAPILIGNVFNILYGHIYDAHSSSGPNAGPGGERDCPDGIDCYRSAYYVTTIASLVGICLSLWSVYHDEYIVRPEREKEALAREHEG
ncbi:MAG: hypothetical protein M1834_005345 [Cirrosporium novae-zelandiae]|nr:MAG: hypothetical protein M1834_005345 [Cirrosporium novae-zelandiae]